MQEADVIIDLDVHTHTTYVCTFACVYYKLESRCLKESLESD